MPPFLPLFERNIFLDFIDPSKVEQDSDVIKDYFEGGCDVNAKVLLEVENQKWKFYLDNLMVIRRNQLFGTSTPIPDEDKKVDQLASEGKLLAQELKQIRNVRPISTRTLATWLNKEARRTEYLEAKSIPYPNDEEHQQHLSWIVSNTLAELYFPEGFFTSGIFKLESGFSTFPYDFLECFLGQRQLYIWYLIYTQRGPEHFLKNLEGVIIRRYIVTRTFSMNAYSLLNVLMFNGNDQNRCNRFFTRRMEKNISVEATYWCGLTNSIGARNEEDSFKNFFMSNPSSNCNFRDPFQPARDSEPGLIEQAIFNHVVGNYCASVNLLFPLIEGVIWDISVAEHLLNGGIYTTSSNLSTRDVKSRQLLDDSGTPIPIRHGAPSLKELLENTRMKNIFHTQFLKFLCGEVFPDERNPILHGVLLDYNSPSLSSRLLLVVEYLHSIIKNKQYLYPVQLDPTGYWTPEKSGDPRFF